MTDNTPTAVALPDPAAALDILPTLPERAPIHDAVQIPVHLVKPNPWNRQVKADGLAELTDSVRRHGVLQPVLVRPVADVAAAALAGQPLYELVAGERRWRASVAADLPTVPALVRHMDDLEVIELMLVENLQREDLHPLDEAAGYARLLRKDHGPQSLHGFATTEALAERLGKSKAYVAQRLTLLKLCPQGVLCFREGELSFSLALRIARLPNHDDQAKATATIVKGWGGEPMNVRAADEYIAREFMLALDRAEFKITDETLVAAAGSCRACSKRTGASPDLFDDIKKGDTCTDGTCYQAKQDAHRARLRAEAEARGLKVIAGAEAKKLQPQQYGEPKGLLALDAVHYNIDGSKPLRKLLAKADVQPVLFERPSDKKLVEMVPTDQAMAALKAAGIVKTTKLPGTTASQRAQDEKRKAETAWRTAVAEACVANAAGEHGRSEQYRRDLLTRVAITLWNEQHNDTHVRLTKLLGWPPLKPRWDSGAGPTAEQHMRGLTDDELCRYLTAAVIVDESYIGPHQTMDKPEGLLAVATLLGVDAAGIKNSLRKLERVPNPKAKAKASTKPTGTTPETALAAALKKAEQAQPDKAAKPAKTKKISPKYRDAATGMTWTGRGLKPAWVIAALANGKTLADLEL